MISFTLHGIFPFFFLSKVSPSRISMDNSKKNTGFPEIDL